MRLHELARLVSHLMTPESRKIERYMYGLAPQIRGMVAATGPKTMQISGALTDEAVRYGSIKKVEKKRNVEEPRKDKNGRDDNKRTKTGNAFATTPNSIGRENTGACRSVPPATPTMHPEGLVAHASTVTAQVILQRIVELWLGMVKIHELRRKSKVDLFAQLKDLKAELALLCVAKVTNGAPNKHSKI
nr:reverse transcriptase domain-containing protein [Tanacetum cinerariifolium]